MLIGPDGLEKLFQAHIAIFGIGGVGGYVVEALARSGIGKLDLVDNDKICLSNINRQIYATHSTIAKYKVDVAKQRILDINPRCIVRAYNIFYNSDSAARFDFSKYDYIIDAIDTVAGKIELVKQANIAGIPIISSMGAGNKMDPTAFKVADIYDTSVCPLARVMRRELRKLGIKSLKVVYSEENPLQNSKENCSQGIRKVVPGSNAFVPSVAGLIIAAEVIKDLIQWGNT